MKVTAAEHEADTRNDLVIPSLVPLGLGIFPARLPETAHDKFSQ